MYSDRFRDAALGLVSTKSFPAIVGTADMMLKSADVSLIGYEKIGSGHCSAIIRGNISDVRLAVQSGVETAEQFGQLVSWLVIPRPMPNLEVILPISPLLSNLADEEYTYSRLSNQAVGLVETIGFPAMVGACDAMLKSAEVHLAAYEMIGAGLCTAIIRGAVADVAVAIEAGMHEAEKIGDLNAVMVIPRPLDELERTLPVASIWLEKRQPVKLPVSVRQRELELNPAKLPDFAKLPIREQERS